MKIPDRKAMGRNTKLMTAGAPWPDSTQPRYMPMAQKGSAPSTSMRNSCRTCTTLSSALPSVSAMMVSITAMMATNSMVMNARAIR